MERDIKTLEKRIDDNREEIDRLLHSDLPLKLLYMRIEFLNAQNEQWINEINSAIKTENNDLQTQNNRRRSKTVQ